MIELLPKWNLHDNKFSFYDVESVSLTELSGRLHGKMNELVEDYNAFADRVNTKIEQHITNATQDQETFETALRQEFQDFIDVVNLKYNGQEKRIEDKIKECEQAVNSAIAQMEAAKNEFIEEIHEAIDELLSAEY